MPFQETEAKVRVELALERLGEEVRGRETLIAGRYVDFLLEGGVVLEIDGKFHLGMR